jgi:regulator of sigma D
VRFSSPAATQNADNEPMMTNHDTDLTKEILRDISQAIFYRYSLTDEQVQIVLDLIDAEAKRHGIVYE